MADPVPMIQCPHCKGSGEHHVIFTKDGKPAIQPIQCGVCGGTGQLPLMGRHVPPAPKPKAPPPKPPAELWPLLIPLAIFVLFFIFLRT
ncbi:MAG: hypothetical protein P8Y67_10045 [Alphaproteobacteria bacterium]